jgi:anti-sigma factor RsiW
MSEHSPSRMEELMAGFVMGNLNPEEAEEFHHLLARDPSLVDESDLLQEILECLPYGLPEEEPTPQLREKILARAENPRRLYWYRSRNFQAATGAIAALLVLALGVDNYRLRQTLSQSASLSLTRETVGTIAISPEVISANQWNGLSELTNDHIKATQQVGNSGDRPKITAQQLAQRFDRERNVSLPVTQLDRDELTFIGGSLCSLVKTKGVRLTYQFEGDRPLSFYQLVKPETATYPHPGSGRLYIEYRHRPAIVLWEDEEFLYALVAEVPRDRLNHLAAAIEDI